MSKRKYLELLIKTFGLVPYLVRSYRTDGCGVQFQIAYGWEIIAHDQSGKFAFSIMTPEGFNDAIKMILEESIKIKASPVCVD